jgi:plastocyanin domain-containing protein
LEEKVMKLSETMFVGILGMALLTANACTRDSGGKAGTDHSQPATGVAIHHVIEISVTSEGFVPAQATVHAGHAVKLIVTRKVENTCATDFVIKEYGINKPLPLNVPVEITFTPTKPGRIRYACPMDMITGEIVAE